MSGSFSPIRTKANPLRTNPTIFQVTNHIVRLLGDRTVPSRRPMMKPAVTTASTPDIPARSAGR